MAMEKLAQVNLISVSVSVTEAVAQWCSVKSCSSKFCKIHRKTPVPLSLH